MFLTKHSVPIVTHGLFWDFIGLFVAYSYATFVSLLLSCSDCDTYCKASKGKLKINMKKYCKKDYGKEAEHDGSNQASSQMTAEFSWLGSGLGLVAVFPPFHTGSDQLAARQLVQPAETKGEGGEEPSSGRKQSERTRTERVCGRVGLSVR